LESTGALSAAPDDPFFFTDSSDGDIPRPDPKFCCEASERCKAQVRGHSFANRDALNAHYRQFHPKHVYPQKRGRFIGKLTASQAERLTCGWDGCSKQHYVFSSPKARRVHRERFHQSDVSGLTCLFTGCNKTFTSPGARATHMLSGRMHSSTRDEARALLDASKSQKLILPSPLTKNVSRYLPPALEFLDGFSAYLRTEPDGDRAYRQKALSTVSVAQARLQIRFSIGLLVAAGRLHPPMEVGLNIFADVRMMESLFSLLAQRKASNGWCYAVNLRALQVRTDRARERARERARKRES
jgi:hypothetical protein